MRVILLAAGRGSRLGAQTHDQPKCLTQLCRRPWLDWQLQALKDGGATSVSLVTGHAASAIPTHALIDQRIHHPRWSQSGPVSSLWAALQLMPDQELIVAYADCLWHADWITRLRSAIANVAISSDDAWQSLWSERFESPLDDAESFRMRLSANRWQLESIGSRVIDASEIEGQFMGLVRLTSAGSALLRQIFQSLSEAQRDALDMTALLSHLIALKQPIEVVRGAGAWIELDHASDLALYAARSAEVGWRHDWRRPPA